MTVQCQQTNDYSRRYQERFAGLIKKYPNIRNHDYKRWHSYPNADHTRVACFEFLQNDSLRESQSNSAKELEKFLEIDPSPSARRLFILEGFNDQIRDLMTTRVDVDPQIFHRHARVGIWEPSREDAGDSPCLPSLIDSSRSFVLKYSQLMHLNLENQQFTLRCLGSERHIASSRVGAKFDGVGSISRKISFSGTRRGQEGWDAVLLVDEPFRHAIFGSRQKNEVAKSVKPPEPFQGGFNDFIKYDSVEDAAAAASPPRTSIFDDLCFYHQHHSKKLRITSDPKSSTIFAQKIVASEYMLLIEYNRYILSHAAWQLSRRDSFEMFHSTWVERAWSDVSSFHGRIEGHHGNVVATISSLELTTASVGDWMNTTRDFQHIEAQLRALRQKAEDVLSSFQSLASIVGNRQSLAEARSVRVLTVLGMTFVPLSLVASLFSMSDGYRPGDNDFWVYFAVSIPLVLAILGLAVLTGHGTNLIRKITGGKHDRQDLR